MVLETNPIYMAGNGIMWMMFQFEMFEMNSLFHRMIEIISFESFIISADYIQFAHFFDIYTQRNAFHQFPFSISFESD